MKMRDERGQYERRMKINGILEVGTNSAGPS